MENTANRTMRPTSITLICVLGFVGALEISWAILYPSISTTLQRLGLGFSLYLTFSALFLFICMIGLWLMKKWGVYTYTALSVINQVVLVFLGRWNIGALLIPAIVLYIGYRHLSKMS